MYAVDEI